ncbi:MAG: hypothetical protein WD231_00985 [Candidatus Woykebacteria bacterium]
MGPELEKIKKRFSGKLVGNAKMQLLVCETLLLFPKEIINFISANVWFISSFDDAWGFVLDSKDLGNKHLVFLGDELFEQDKYDQHYTVAHEIGHVMLGHKNAILAPQTKRETTIQEAQAHQFALKYLPKNPSL